MPRAATIMKVLILNALEVEKSILFKLIAFSWSLYPCKKVVSQQPIADSKNTTVILWMNGKSGNCKLMKIDPNNDISAAISTDREVAFFQNSATRKITTIPGEK